MRRTKQGEGFTLLELVMVVAVMGILFAILAVPLTRARRFAMVTQCQANLRTVYGANMEYMQENDWHKPEIAYDLREGVVMIFFAGTVIRFGGEPIGQGKVLQYLGDKVDLLLCPSVTVPGDTDTDRDNWYNADRAGSSYLYEWYHPPSLSGSFSPWPAAFYDWLESVRFNTRPVTEALLMDFNFESVPGTDTPYLSHKYLRKVNVVHNDGAVIGYSYDDGLYGAQWGVLDVIDMMDNAHNLRK